jgi:hypothetical protein
MLFWGIGGGVAFILLWLFVVFVVPFTLFRLIPFFIVDLPRFSWLLIKLFFCGLAKIPAIAKKIKSFFQSLAKRVTKKRKDSIQARKDAILEKQFSRARAILDKEPDLVPEGYRINVENPDTPEAYKIYLGLKEPVEKTRKFLFLFRRRVGSTQYAKFLKEHYTV